MRGLSGWRLTTKADGRASVGVGYLLGNSVESGALISESLKKTVICQDLGDGSGDLIIDLPQDVIEDMKVAPGDLLSIELVDGMLLLSALRDADTKT